MPPRKMMNKTKDSESNKSSTKMLSGRMGKKNLHEPKEPVEPQEPEIDVQAAIEEMIKESNEKIQAALQQRQEQLIQTISQVDVIANQPVKGGKK